MANVKLYEVANDQIINCLVGAVEQIAELTAMTGHEIVYEPTRNLRIGDLRVNGEWTRNVDGVQTVLTERPTYDELSEGIAEAETALEEAYGLLYGGVAK